MLAKCGPWHPQWHSPLDSLGAWCSLRACRELVCKPLFANPHLVAKPCLFHLSVPRLPPPWGSSSAGELLSLLFQRRLLLWRQQGCQEKLLNARLRRKRGIPRMPFHNGRAFGVQTVRGLSRCNHASTSGSVERPAVAPAGTWAHI